MVGNTAETEMIGGRVTMATCVTVIRTVATMPNFTCRSRGSGCCPPRNTMERGCASWNLDHLPSSEWIEC